MLNELGHKIVDITSSSNVMIPPRYNDFYFKTHAGATSLGRHVVSPRRLIGQQGPRSTPIGQDKSRGQDEWLCVGETTRVMQSKQGRGKRQGPQQGEQHTPV